MRAQDFQGVKLYRVPPQGKRTDKDGVPVRPKKMGKIHFPVFTPDGTRLVGFMVTPPEIAGMVKRPDVFVAYDALEPFEGVLCAVDEKGSFDKAAGKRLGVDIDHCLIWTGMDVRTRSGEALGYCADAAFNPKTGAVESYALTRSATASMLLGNVEMPTRYLVGYREGCMIVDDAVVDLDVSGGAAAKAAEVTVAVSSKVKEGAKVLDDRGSVAVEKGTRAVGRQLGKTKGMFKAFTTEFKKAAGTPPKKKKGA